MSAQDAVPSPISIALEPTGCVRNLAVDTQAVPQADAPESPYEGADANAQRTGTIGPLPSEVTCCLSGHVVQLFNSMNSSACWNNKIVIILPVQLSMIQYIRMIRIAIKVAS